MLNIKSLIVIITLIDFRKENSIGSVYESTYSPDLYHDFSGLQHEKSKYSTTLSCQQQHNIYNPNK
jgi:hypothetical protein